MTCAHPLSHSKAGKRTFKGGHEKTQSQAINESESKAGTLNLKGRHNTTQRQARKDTKARMIRLLGSQIIIKRRPIRKGPNVEK